MDAVIERRAYQLYNDIMIDPNFSKSLKSSVPPPYQWLEHSESNARIWTPHLKSWETIMKYHKYMLSIAKLSGRLDRQLHHRPNKRRSL
jgi:hypothetical protein